MKFYDTHFEDYINNSERISLHPKLKTVYKSFPEDINKLQNIIFYGPSGVGKYTQMLESIKKYSPSKLKYERKVFDNNGKTSYVMKISDIHIEVDISLLGCNSKNTWNEIYLHITDIISSSNNKISIIVCKNFHNIHNELLDSFYSYMQTPICSNIKMKFIFITEHICLIPNTIINRCKLIRVPRPTLKKYNKCLNNILQPDYNINEIRNIKNIQSNTTALYMPYKIICDEIIDIIINIDNFKFMDLRDKLYDMFIFNLNISDCLWYIITKIYENIKNDKKYDKIINKTVTFFDLYNNNYRPIYHLENLIIYIINIIHEFEPSN